VKMLWMMSAAIVVLYAFGSHAGNAQDVSAPSDVLDRLKQQPASETRKATTVVVPNTESGGASIEGSQAGRQRSLETLLEQVEANKGAQQGTVKPLAGKGATLNLQHDLTKVRANFSSITQAPFASALSDLHVDLQQATQAVTPATVEYRAKNNSDAVEQVVSVKSKNSIAANAFVSGLQPVTLSVENARLTASQDPTGAPEPGVTVRVGDEAREMKVGDVGQFGAFDVRILASVNRTGKKNYEGLPYALRIQVMPLQ
jgi:hypothetical protein